MTPAASARRLVEAIGVVASVSVAGPAAAQLPSVDSLAKLVPRSAFVFVASVVAPSVPVVPRGPVLRHIAALRVLESIATPPGFRMRRGDRVQLVVYAADAPAVGSRAVVFATGWLADDTLSLIQVARFAAQSSAEWRRVKTSYDSLRLAGRRAALQQSVETASLVTVAVVDSVVPVPDRRPPIARGEHDPVWARVSITPRRVAKGDSALVSQRVVLLVPTNRSNLWAHAPRLAPGDTALFVLSAIPSASPMVKIDSAARFILPDSVSVRRTADTTLLRTPR